MVMLFTEDFTSDLLQRKSHQNIAVVIKSEDNVTYTKKVMINSVRAFQSPYCVSSHIMIF